jgi:hypothetical protein
MLGAVPISSIVLEGVHVMTWGIPTTLFLQFHVFISLVAIAAGIVVLYGLLQGGWSAAWTALFLATTLLTSLTGFPLEPFGMTPARVFGVILLVLLALAVAALYGVHLAGSWRWVYVASATAALYLNVFVGVVQSFQNCRSCIHWHRPDRRRHSS